MNHTCHARGCNREIPNQLLMCSYHWRLVPTPQRLEVWKHYRPGQEIDKRPSPEYLQAMEAAIEAVAKAEARMKAARAREREQIDGAMAPFDPGANSEELPTSDTWDGRKPWEATR